MIEPCRCPACRAQAFAGRWALVLVLLFALLCCGYAGMAPAAEPAPREPSPDEQRVIICILLFVLAAYALRELLDFIERLRRRRRA